MPVTILTDIEKEVLTQQHLEDGISKSELARMYEVSTRTISRVIEEMTAPKEEEVISDDEMEVEVEVDAWDIPVIGADHYQEPEPEYEYNVVANRKSISISRVAEDGSVDTVNIDKSHKNFDSCIDLIKNNGFDNETLAEVYALADTKTFIERFTKGKITVDPAANQVSYRTASGSDRMFSGRLVTRLIDAVKAQSSDKIEGLVNFAEKLSRNPSKRVFDELYDFLEASDIEINQDGDVICWKKVRGNFTDIHSGKFDNSPGTSPRVERNEVDENSRNLCSNGLHVCSRAYLPHFGGWGDNKVVKVSVDPSDFVSIPEEYFSGDDTYNVKAKARVCGYHVLEEVKL